MWRKQKRIKRITTIEREKEKEFKEKNERCWQERKRDRKKERKKIDREIVWKERERERKKNLKERKKTQRDNERKKDIKKEVYKLFIQYWCLLQVPYGIYFSCK